VAVCTERLSARQLSAWAFLPVFPDRCEVLPGLTVLADETIQLRRLEAARQQDSNGLIAGEALFPLDNGRSVVNGTSRKHKGSKHP
jgi:hypothetical protein